MRRRAAWIAATLLGGALLSVALIEGTAAAATTTVHAAFDGHEAQMPNRLVRDGDPSTCEAAPFPGTRAGPSLFKVFPFCNTGEERCFTANFDQGNCGDDVHLMAYLDQFDPGDLAKNYAGDVGVSDSGPFSFVVPAGEHFLIVAQTNFGIAECAFSFTIDAMRCIAPAPLLSPTGIALTMCVLGIVAAAALRRSRRGLAVLVVCAALAGLTGPAAAPIGADPTPRSPNACALDCSAAYKACAQQRCDSGAWDKNPQCLSECHRTFEACLQTCH